MKRPATASPRRPCQASPGTARTARDAAVHLVRLEFDRSRLQQGIAQANQRAAAYAEELRRNDAQRDRLLHIIKTDSNQC